MNRYTQIDSPIGPLTLFADGESLTGLSMNASSRLRERPDLRCDPQAAVLRQAAQQLAEYFEGRRHRFDLPLALHGTVFQRRVWQALTDIPYGQTWSYARLARYIGSPNACRAVGLANGRNPLAVIVPCHRVIGADGSLTGFGGGLPRKAWLLRHEGACHAPLSGAQSQFEFGAPARR